ncbi:hypothetical protein [Mucilaginibacter lacusdianchii]|uniref:hypothetical protein n=1 Tax=Mucilaginibacter lacusdianchii TaxID=2684211 RepID=UPI00131BA71D|nr:hypothetical protein [Mucilaginibacter sp. JXJ CY 39]
MTAPNLAPQFAAFSILLTKMAADSRLKPSHISLFAALFIQWQRNGFNSPFRASRRTLMALSRIASLATYHKCISELHTYGYIQYHPSFHPTLASQVHLFHTLKASPPHSCLP